jgi:hypothetical protein
MTSERLSEAAVRGPLTLDVIRNRGTISVPEAGRVLGIGRDAAYAAAARGEIPVLTLGRALRVPVPKLLRLLGLDLDPEDSEAPVAVRGARQENIHYQADRYRHDHPPAA